MENEKDDNEKSLKYNSSSLEIQNEKPIKMSYSNEVCDNSKYEIKVEQWKNEKKNLKVKKGC